MPTTAQQAESAANAALESAEGEQRHWQERWEAFNRELGGTYQTTQVERTRIEQLDDQLRRLAAQADRLAVERDQLQLAQRRPSWANWKPASSSTRESNDALQQELQQQPRAAAGAAQPSSTRPSANLERARRERDRTRSELVSLDALQKAALGEADREAGKWLAVGGACRHARASPRRSKSNKGWERGVESVLGDALEAVHVESLDAAARRPGDLASWPS